MKKLILIVRKIIFAFLVIYGFDILTCSFNILIPLNIFTISTVSFLGIPGFVSLIVLFFVVR